MSEGIVVAIIGAVAAIMGAAIGYGKKSKEQAVLDAEREQQQKDFQNEIKSWMQRVDKKLDEHNGYAQKFSDMTTAIVGIQKDIEYLKERKK